jgi:hypothetical protein
MFVDYRRICEDQCLAIGAQTHGRPSRKLDQKSIKFGIALGVGFLLALVISLTLFYLHFRYFVAPTMFNGLGEAFDVIFRRLD